MQPEQLVALISAIGFGIQQFLQVIVDPLASVLLVMLKQKSGSVLPDGTTLLPGGVSDVDAKKVVLGFVSIGFGMLIASAATPIRVLAVAGLTTVPEWDWFITALTISAGTEGANSVLKLVQYIKDAVKGKTPPSVAQNSPVPQAPAGLTTADGRDDFFITPNSGDDQAAAVDSALPMDGHGDSENGHDVALLTVAAVAPVATAVDWRVAKSLLLLRDQVNQKAPNRSKASDGFIGDAAHASRQSDHNPWVQDGNKSVVTAFDITNDPAHGCDVNAIMESIRGSRDERVKYIIWNKRIASSQPKNGNPAWAWRVYTGPNPHVKHAHISVKSEKSFYDSQTQWVV